MSHGAIEHVDRHQPKPHAVLAPQPGRRGSTLHPWQFWGASWSCPTSLVFVVFVVYPVVLRLLAGARIRQSYVKLSTTRSSSASVVNTLVFLFVAINLKMAGGAGAVRASS